jgi:hypothetical protein
MQLPIAFSYQTITRTMIRSRSIPAFILFVSLAFSAAAQTHKLSMNLTYGSRNTNEFSGINGPQVSYAWQSKCLGWHEVELGNIHLNKIGTTRQQNFTLRYQYSIPLLTSRLKGRFQPFIGVGATNFNGFAQNVPEVPHLYRTSVSAINFRTYLAPGVNYSISERAFASVSIPVNFAAAQYTSNRVENPTWSPAEQRNSQFTFDAFRNPGFILRAGAGVLF